jgi:glycosyltransferase involved in cell wall biosynthesis
MRPLRVVLVMIEPPLPFGNAAARGFYVLLKGLASRGHDVTAFAACHKPEEIQQARELFPSPQYDLRCYPFPKRGGIQAKARTILQPYSYMFGPDLRRDLTETLSRPYDVLHLEQLWSGWLGLAHKDRALVSLHYLFGIDLEDQSGGFPRPWIDRRMMFWGERRLIRAYKYFRACSQRLVPEILRIHPGAVVESVPFGLDMDQYPYIPDAKRTAEPLISVIGSMGWYPSRSAAERLLERLWPEIRKRVPGARVQIVGWGAKSALQRFEGMPDVTIEENVPDIRPYFERTGVLMYAPGRGSGMKIKIMESFAFGVPVVTTSEGVEGMPAEDGVHAGICEDDAGLIERAVRLLTDTGLQNRQRRAARSLIERHCGSEPTLDAIERIYCRMLAEEPARLTQTSNVV